MSLKYADAFLFLKKEKGREEEKWERITVEFDIQVAEQQIVERLQPILHQTWKNS